MDVLFCPLLKDGGDKRDGTAVVCVPESALPSPSVTYPRNRAREVRFNTREFLSLNAGVSLLDIYPAFILQAFNSILFQQVRQF